MLLDCPVWTDAYWVLFAAVRAASAATWQVIVICHGQADMR